MAFCTPPPGACNTPPVGGNQNFTALVEAFKIGVITKEELRAKILAWNPNSPGLPTPADPPTPAPEPAPNNKPAPNKKRRALALTNDRLNKKCKKDDENDKPLDEKPPKKKKKRPGCTGDPKLRTLVEGPTRQRFFEQCCKPDSLLWSLTPSGVEIMHSLLFQKAAKLPMDMIYAAHPGPTRGVSSTKMLKQIRWKVSKDRSNWKGKTPKRDMQFGVTLEYDWQAALNDIQNNSSNSKLSKSKRSKCGNKAIKQLQQPGPAAVVFTGDQEEVVVQIPQQQKPAAQANVQIPQQQNAAAQANVLRVCIGCASAINASNPSVGETQRCIKCYQAVRAEPVNAPAPAPVNPVIDLDLLKICEGCEVGVWIGPEKELPRDVKLAHPTGSDWSNPNVKAYCDICWGPEAKVLAGLSGKHCAVGKAKTKTKPKGKGKAKTKPKGKGKGKAKTKGKGKASLGGVQGDLHVGTSKHVSEPPTAIDSPRWKVGQAVNCKFTDKRYYWAFIMQVHEDKTYDVYFPEEKDSKVCTLQKIPESHIKKPINSGRTSKSLKKYKGKTFFDVGSTGKDKDEPYFEAGEFTVVSISNENNTFACKRLDAPEDSVLEYFNIGYAIELMIKYDNE